MRKKTLHYEPVELNFGTSGLRGLVSDMTDLECYINAVAFLRFIHDNEGYENGSDIYLAGDLRDSTSRILRAVQRAVSDSGYHAVYCGLIPTPALAYYALYKQAPGIMVTGSHIPADRNGIKFYKIAGEVMKEDEPTIKSIVAEVRERLYDQTDEESIFDEQGMFREPTAQLPVEIEEARRHYLRRFTAAFGPAPLADLSIVFYQHSAVGRDLLVDLLASLGAKVIPVGRSDTFMPIDSENVTDDNRAYFKQLATEHPEAFAIVSTDGDSDRPFVIDESGVFHRGDVLGAVVASWLQADSAAFPVTTSDAVTQYLDEHHIAWQPTRVGSPYVIKAMTAGLESGKKRVVCWEVNGGFMTATDLNLPKGMGLLKALPTRDAILPILIAIIAARQKGATISDLFDSLPRRYSQAGLIDNVPTEVSRHILQSFPADTPDYRSQLSRYFPEALGFSAIARIDVLDGIRIVFQNGDIVHLRPSGNAPQLRVYSVAATQERADEIVRLALKEPDGICRTMEQAIAG